MNVLIGIQARSGSTRLPRKAFELISGKTTLDRVVDTCKHAADMVENFGHKCAVAVLTPTGDPIVEEFQSRIEIIEGPEHDVLSRYMIAVEKHDPDLTVRITGDCPLIPGAFISYMVSIAMKRGYDYFSNSDERFRTAIDGCDCEVISYRAFEYLDQAATEAYDREHVTPHMRRNPPPWAKLGLAFNNFDLSDIKLSIDTAADLNRVRQAYERSFSKYQDAVKIYGKGAIHRL